MESLLLNLGFNGSLIGHSLGNVIIRDAFQKEYPDLLGTVVMLAPPNQPALLAKRLKKNLIYRVFTGDSGQKLSEEEFYNGLPVPTVPFIQGIDCLIIRKIHRLISCGPEPFAQNQHGKSSATLTMY